MTFYETLGTLTEITAYYIYPGETKTTVTPKQMFLAVEPPFAQVWKPPSRPALGDGLPYPGAGARTGGTNA